MPQIRFRSDPGALIPLHLSAAQRLGKICELVGMRALATGKWARTHPDDDPRRKWKQDGGA